MVSQAAWTGRYRGVKRKMSRLRKVSTRFDDYYEMMSDPVRTDAFRRAVKRAVRPGDVVVDLGAGLGILSFFALQAGARKVYAIEKMDSIELFREVARLNGLDKRIVFIHGNSKECTLDEKADVIVSETLGSFALDENTLEFTIDARERFLKPGGRMVPEVVRLWLAPVESERIYRKLDFWRNVGGVDFSPALGELTRRLLVEDIDEESLLSRPLVYGGFDFRKIKTPFYENRLTFTFERPGTVHGLAGWFDAELFDDIAISTSPSSPRTHWRQAFFPMKEPIKVIRGDFMEVLMRVGPKPGMLDDTVISYDFFCSQKALEIGAQKVGRNDPCPCGSGNKFKKCCGV